MHRKIGGKPKVFLFCYGFDYALRVQELMFFIIFL